MKGATPNTTINGNVMIVTNFRSKNIPAHNEPPCRIVIADADKTMAARLNDKIDRKEILEK